MEDVVELRWFFSVIRRWLWLIVICTLLGASSAFVVSSWIPPTYRASTSLLIRAGGLGDSDYNAILASEHLAATYKMLLTKRPVIEAAAWNLGLDPRQTERKVQARLIPDTSLIELTVEDSNPRLAAEIANEIVSAFMQSARESGGIRGRELVVVEPAVEPLAPVAPRKLVYTSVTAMVGFALASGIAFVIEYLDDTVKTPDDISQALGLATFGTIGRLARREEELVMVTQPFSPVAEAFRVLCTNVRFSSVGRPLRTLLLTSPSSAEGKSIAVANLAVAMAQAGLSVVAVDADLRGPRLHQLFSLDPTREGGTGDKLWWGLTGSLLEGHTDGRLLSTQVDGLRVLLSGELPPNPAEMMGSQHMQKVLHDLAQQVNVVLIDSPPILPAADAAALAPAVDGVLLVLQAGHTRRRAAQQALESLRQVGANVVGVVLNRVPPPKDSYYYSHHKHYGNGKRRRKYRQRQ